MLQPWPPQPPAGIETQKHTRTRRESRSGAAWGSRFQPVLLRPTASESTTTASKVRPDHSASGHQSPSASHIHALPSVAAPDKLLSGRSLQVPKAPSPCFWD